MQVTCQICHELTLRNSKSVYRDLSYETHCLLRNSSGSSEVGNGGGRVFTFSTERDQLILMFIVVD